MPKKDKISKKLLPSFFPCILFVAFIYVVYRNLYKGVIDLRSYCRRCAKPHVVLLSLFTYHSHENLSTFLKTSM